MLKYALRKLKRVVLQPRENIHLMQALNVSKASRLQMKNRMKNPSVRKQRILEDESYK